MLYYLHELTDLFSPLRVFQYVTVRTFAGAGTAFMLSIVLGPYVIERLRTLKFGQQVRTESDAPKLGTLHAAKAGTPTMGGILIVLAITVSTLLWAIPTSRLVWLALLALWFLAFVGFMDDYSKIRRKQSKGLSARQKLALQLVFAMAVGGALLVMPETRDTVRSLMVPMLKTPLVSDMGTVGTLLFVALVIVGASNAVNLTDGLDGLAIGCTSSVAIAYLIMSYVAGHVLFAKYLNVPYVAGAGELAVFCGCMMGASLGFLWHNCHPASVFMGDTGSLALGGAIGMVALLVKQEAVLIVVGGVFVMEAVSVILQVASFRLTGRRIFAMAPLHHHFEMKKWTETQVTIRFWILSILFAILGILMLKLR
jgi:phospho-N-acetylmuramoyl-pentapeptide-transferase